MKRAFFVFAVALVAASCGHRGGQPAVPPLLTVDVAHAVSEPIVRPMRFQSLIYSNYDATIQPRTQGYLLSKEFSKGMPVRKGQTLFTIDAAEVRLAVESNRSALSSAKVALAEATNNYRRAVPLAAIDAISQSSLDQYKASYAAAQAKVEEAQAQLDNSLLELSYATVVSPIDGIIDDTGATIGDWVGPGTKYSTLATISNTEEVSVHISIPFARYLEVRGGEEDSTPSYDNRALLSDISLVLSDGSDYPYKGSYAYTERNAGDQTGTIIIVASFPNPRRVLKVGQTATVVANVGSPKGVVLVPQRAVVQMLDTAGVWVVGKDNAVSYKLVTLGSTFGDMWIVESGLTGGEVVVVGGGQKLRSGQKVKTQFHS
ncbi:MAG: efflux RND transporter periplasmic adaptor subunit [Tidjanibacter sp.]|nr:efflux RND transporter periplasmic adaptor subunit [Tidjanibacter sp.]